MESKWFNSIQFHLFLLQPDFKNYVHDLADWTLFLTLLGNMLVLACQATVLNRSMEMNLPTFKSRKRYPVCVPSIKLGEMCPFFPTDITAEDIPTLLYTDWVWRVCIDPTHPDLGKDAMFWYLLQPSPRIIGDSVHIKQLIPIVRMANVNMVLFHRLGQNDHVTLFALLKTAMLSLEPADGSMQVVHITYKRIDNIVNELIRKYLEEPAFTQFVHMFVSDIVPPMEPIPIVPPTSPSTLAPAESVNLDQLFDSGTLDGNFLAHLLG